MDVNVVQHSIGHIMDKKSTSKAPKGSGSNKPMKGEKGKPVKVVTNGKPIKVVSRSKSDKGTMSKKPNGRG